MGVVLRNEKGKVIIAYYRLENEMTNPESVEAVVMLRGLQFCVQWGILKLMVESDCLLLVNKLHLSRDNFF